VFPPPHEQGFPSPHVPGGPCTAPPGENPSDVPPSPPVPPNPPPALNPLPPPAVLGSPTTTDFPPRRTAAPLRPGLGPGMPLWSPVLVPFFPTTTNRQAPPPESFSRSSPFAPVVDESFRTCNFRPNHRPLSSVHVGFTGGRPPGPAGGVGGGTGGCRRKTLSSSARAPSPFLFAGHASPATPPPSPLNPHGTWSLFFPLSLPLEGPGRGRFSLLPPVLGEMVAHRPTTTAKAPRRLAGQFAGTIPRLNPAHFSGPRNGPRAPGLLTGQLPWLAGFFRVF